MTFSSSAWRSGQTVPDCWVVDEMPALRLEDEQGRRLTDMRLNAPAWAPADRISRGRDKTEQATTVAE
jgi:hypothetical protein